MPKRSGREHWAVLLVDFLNPLDFNTDPNFVKRAVAAAKATKRLVTRSQRAGIPVIYANDHWGEWTRNFDDLSIQIASQDVPGRALIELLAPAPGAYTVLKPRHSAFYGTPLKFLLEELQVDSLVICGIAADNCVFFTAGDAYLNKFRVWVPANCVASENDAWRVSALAHMKRVLKARTAAA